MSMIGRLSEWWFDHVTDHMRTCSTRIVAILIIVGIVLLPIFVSSFHVFQLTGAMAYGIAALGLILITGYVGEVSLSHNAFFALGSYVCALAINDWNAHFIIAVLVAAAVCFGVGLVAGLASRKVSGLYLAVATLAIAISVTPIIKYLDDWTGGTSGVFVPQPAAPKTLDLTDEAWIYWVVLITALLVLYLVRNVVSGVHGRAFIAARDVPLAAAAFGIRVAWVKQWLVAVGSMLGGIGGAIMTLSIGFIAPDSFEFMLSISFLAAVVVGGMHAIYGAILAGLFLQYVPSFAADISEAFAGALYGGIIIVIMIAFPDGLAGAVTQFKKWTRSITNRGLNAVNQ